MARQRKEHNLCFVSPQFLALLLFHSVQAFSFICKEGPLEILIKKKEDSKEMDKGLSFSLKEEEQDC